jgi:hypothetical protein
LLLAADDPWKNRLALPELPGLAEVPSHALALPLALAPAMRFSFSELPLATV